MLNFLAIIGGILAVPLFPALPVFHISYFVVSLGCIFFRRLRLLGCLGLGLCWGVYSGHQLIAQQLPTAFEGVDIIVQGEIIDLPEQRETGQRFLFRIDSIPARPSELSIKPFPLPMRVLLTAYDYHELAVGQRWQWTVRLKRPRALVNEGGFDYHRWLLSRRIGATGYIRQAEKPRSLTALNSYPIQSFRANVRNWILASAKPSVQGPLIALAVGDNSVITPTQWQVFRQTGTGHLMAISGLHIGLVAIFGFLLGRLMATALTLLFQQWRWLQVLPCLCSCLVAGTYAALAGFGLPTQRALIMVVLFNLALVWGRTQQPSRALAIAAIVVLVVDPLAGLDMGFWLSFAAVLVLISYFQHRRRIPKKQLPGVNKAQGFLHAQGVVFVGLFLPLLMFNTPFTLLAPIANTVVIPVVSVFAVIPLLVGMAFFSVGMPGADALLTVAGLILELCLQGLTALLSLDLPTLWSPAGSANFLTIGIALVGVAGLLLARGLPGRWLGLVLLLPLLIPYQPSKPSLHISVLDVGQGLAVMVQTPQHNLLYDAGAKFSERFDTGDAVVLAFLRQQGVKQLDKMIISHGDNDHAGGAKAVMAGVKVSEVITGEEIPTLPGATQRCDSDQQWQWDGVDFQLLEPDINVARGDNNNRSCILLVSYAGHHLLLPGDIESSVERALLNAQRLSEPIDIIIAPHHGSRTSSTTAFVETTQPQYVIFSAGYRSRYGHPHPFVTERYQKIGATLYNTAIAGQIDIVWPQTSAGSVSISSLRQHRPRYWY